MTGGGWEGFRRVSRGLSGSKRVCPEESDIGDKMGIFDSFEDDNGFLVEIGTIVGFKEECVMSEMELMDGRIGLSYSVNELPNLADTVVMTEVQYVPHMDKEGGLWLPPRNAKKITVKPFQIGVI